MRRHKKIIIVLSIIAALVLAYALNITHLKIDKAGIEYIVVEGYTLKKDNEILDIIKTLEKFNFAKYGKIEPYQNGYRGGTTFVTIYYANGNEETIMIGGEQVRYKGKDYKRAFFPPIIMHEEICEVLVKHGYIESVWGY